MGDVLVFQVDRGLSFEMTVAGDAGATLKFMGTPVEDTSWELKRQK
jgi:hypothetical protein